MAIAVSRKDFLATVMGNNSAALMEAIRPFQPSMGSAAGGTVAAACRYCAHLKLFSELVRHLESHAAVAPKEEMDATPK
eukprot:8971049-Alexandrium_andersonii.AAC.1